MKNDLLAYRHIGISEKDEEKMLQKIGVKSLDELIDKTIPANIRLKEPLALPKTMTEYEFGQHIAGLAAKNKLYTTYIGMGWYNTITPAVIQRNVFENPVWYTSYTPYQTEVSQGRLEALMNFQTAVCDLTGMPLANCSLLDEATAAAEAVTMMYALRPRDMQKSGANVVFVDEAVFPQTLAVMTTRAIPQGIELRIGKYHEMEFTPDIFACVLQYPNAAGNVEDYRAFVEKAHAANCKVAVAADILSLALLTPPGEWGADIVFGTTQRLGTPMFYGGPSAAYFATRDEYKRNMPGRIIGWSKDKYGKLCYRMALQTREQHIKREKATSNICTAQALLATMAGFYAVYHGPEGIRTIAERIHSIAVFLEKSINRLGYKQVNAQYFDTLRFYEEEKQALKNFITKNGLNVKHLLNTHLHLDHIFGNPFMLKEFGLKAEANQADEFWIDEAPKQSRMFGFQLQEAPVPLGTYLHDGDIITFGNTKLEAIHVPGHSPGSLVYYCAADHCMFSGDVLFQGSIGRADLTGGNFDELIEHICSRLFILPNDTIVYPGHGAPTTIGIEKAENPFFR